MGYHGQVGHHLADYRNGNQLTTAQAANIASLPPNTPIPPADQTPYFSLVGEGNFVLITESEARMNYNSGQVTLRQRPTHGLEYTLNYTWAKSLTESSGNYPVANTTMNGSTIQNSYDLHADWGPSGMDIRHSMNFVGVYHLPFGRGQAYGRTTNGFLDAALGGWKLSASAFLYSGFPVTLFGPNNSNTSNIAGLSRPNQYRPMIITNRTIDNWWGTDPSAQPCVPSASNPTGADNGICAYGVAAANTFGTAHNNTERGPGYRQVDASLFKDFHVWREQHVIGVRADFFNIFNIASYGNPDNGITDGNFGNISNQGSGAIRSNSRQIQLSLHYSF